MKFRGIDVRIYSKEEEMRRLVSLGILIGLFAAAGRAWCASPAPVTLTMEEALRRALDENLSVLAAGKGVTDAQGAKKSAAAGSGPTVFLRGTGTAYDMPQGPDRDASLSVGLSETLYAGGRLKAKREQAALALSSAEHSFQRTREQVAFSVWRAFCDALYQQEVCRTAREALDFYEKTEQELIRRVEFGLATHLDRVRVSQQKEDARAALIAANNALESAAISLKTLLRLPPDQPLVLRGTLNDGVSEGGRLNEDAPDEETVLSRREDYLAKKAQAAAAEKEIQAAASGLKPTVQVTGAYRFAYDAAGTPSVNRSDQWTASLSVSVPVFDSGLTSGQVKSAKARRDQANLALESASDEIRADLQQARLSLTSALETVEAGRKNLRLAEESLKYAEAGYKEGVSPQLDVLQARTELTRAGQSLAGYLRNARIAQASLWLAQGRMIEQALGK